MSKPNQAWDTHACHIQPTQCSHNWVDSLPHSSRRHWMYRLISAFSTSPNATFHPHALHNKQHDNWRIIMYECPSSNRSRGWAAGTWHKKWCTNLMSNNSLVIHPESERPYIVPGTSFSHISGLRHFLSNNTKGDKQYLAALQQAKAVIWVLCYCSWMFDTFSHYALCKLWNERHSHFVTIKYLITLWQVD